jgi:hypothetical protein
MFTSSIESEEAVLHRIRALVLSITSAIAIVASSVLAGDPLASITQGDQYSLAVGTVVSIEGNTIEFEPGAIILGDSLPSRISVLVREEFGHREVPGLAANDYVVLSLNKQTDLYYVAWGLFKATSLDAASLKITDGTLLPSDHAALQWFVNSGGTEDYFVFHGRMVFVKHADETWTKIYPPPIEPVEFPFPRDSVSESKDE